MEEQEIVEQKAIKSAIDGDFEKAINLNKELLKLGVKTVSVYNRLGRAYLELKNYKEAEKNYSFALELDAANQTALRGVEMAKNQKSHNLPSVSHKELIQQDSSTSNVIDLSINKAKLNDTYTLTISKNRLSYFIKDSSGKTVKKISRSRLNIKPQIYPTEIFGKIIEISNGFAKLKLTSKEPIFRGTKQEVDPYFEMEKKEVLAEKKEIVKILQEDREDE